MITFKMFGALFTNIRVKCEQESVNRSKKNLKIKQR